MPIPKPHFSHGMDLAAPVKDQILDAELPIKLLGYRVLFDPAGDGRESVIEKPDLSENRETIGLVAALGNGRQGPADVRYPFDVKVGDRVKVSSYGGVPIEVDGHLYKIISAEDILAIVP